MALVMVIIGLLFKLMSWRGAFIMLLAGCVSLAPIAIIAMMKYKSGKSYFYAAILKRAAIFGTPALLLLLLPPTIITEIKYRAFPEYVKAVKAAAANPENPELQRKADVEKEKLYAGEEK